MYPPPIQRLIDELAELPGIGPKQAARCVFFLLKDREGLLTRLIPRLEEVKNRIGSCSDCFSIYEKEGHTATLCAICADPLREKNKLCIVRNETDLFTIEKIRLYRGRYFVLGEHINIRDKSQNAKERISHLKTRLEKNPGNIDELILGTNPDHEGEITALYVQRELEPLKIKITRLGRGLPTGGELEYADEETLRHALESRR